MSAVISMINGPVVIAKNASGFKLRDMVMVGDKKLIGEVIAREGDTAILQVYEETQGLKLGEEVENSGKPLSVTLAPGIIGNIFDGIQRPLKDIEEKHGSFIPEGVGLARLNSEKLWEVNYTVEPGDRLEGGEIYATVAETSLIEHRLMLPIGISGEVKKIGPKEASRVDEVLLIENSDGVHSIKMAQENSVRISRPLKENIPVGLPLVTGQRVIDVLFPIAKGGKAAIPGGFGTGKTITQHQIAKWSDADIIVYIGCGERGNEMSDVLSEFKKLIDPKSGEKLIERTILIANTSNMPVAAREASIYTGITIAEYYRDMGYDVAIMADSTSRWAEALREISGRLEEMPAEEGYPAYLASRMAEFYERAGSGLTYSNKNGSITIIGAVSPAGGDFSEPVTQNTKRYINTFLALDKALAYARHYPSINWVNSYSSYAEMLENWFDENVDINFSTNRKKAMRILFEEDSLMEIVQLVGEGVLPDSQRLILKVAHIIKTGFLQQNAFHKDDMFMELDKQFLMLKMIIHFYDRAEDALSKSVPLSRVLDEELITRLSKMKYEIPNDELEKFDKLMMNIDVYFDKALEDYRGIDDEERI